MLLSILSEKLSGFGPYLSLRKEVRTRNKTYPFISTSYFDQCLLCEVTCQSQKAYIAVIYRSLSQSCNEFDNFLFNIEKLL